MVTNGRVARIFGGGSSRISVPRGRQAARGKDTKEDHVP